MKWYFQMLNQNSKRTGEEETQEEPLLSEMKDKTKGKMSEKFSLLFGFCALDATCMSFLTHTPV